MTSKKVELPRAGVPPTKLPRQLAQQAGNTGIDRQCLITQYEGHIRTLVDGGTISGTHQSGYYSGHLINQDTPNQDTL